MMKTMILSDLKWYGKNRRFMVLILILVVFGVFAGSNARFTLRENLAYNAPYQIAFIASFLSLTSLFFSTIYTAQLTLKEIDHQYNLIYFSLPISKKQFLWSRFIVLFLLTFLSTLLFSISFFIGREIMTNHSLSVAFSVLYYILPFIIFTAFNSFFLVAVLYTIAWTTKNKLYVYIAGLFLYVFYMVALLFSGSPFMAGQLPQSKQAQFLSGIFDPFGISAFFYQTSSLSTEQRNTDLLDFSGLLLANRTGIFIIAILCLYVITKKVSVFKKNIEKRKVSLPEIETISQPFQFVNVQNNPKTKWLSLLSFTKMNIQQIIKSISFILLSVGLLFAIGMEMYAEIEKGIRIPQKYATSGLMVSVIIQNFYVLGAFIMVFYANELHWRSKSYNFQSIEESTNNYPQKFWAIALTLTGLSFFLTSVLILEGIIFQWIFHYPVISFSVYIKTYLFTTLPLISVIGLVLLIQKKINQKYLSLAVSGIIVIMMTTALGKTIFKYPLVKFLYSINFDYSDMNGFGVYENAFVIRWLFGFLLITFFLFLGYQHKKSLHKISFWLYCTGFITIISLVGNKVISDYTPKNNEQEIEQRVTYEKQFRQFQNLSQPTITAVNSQVDLFPEENRYMIKGNYALENKTSSPIDQILFNFSDGFTIKKAELIHHHTIKITQQFQVIHLAQPLLPHQKANFFFEISYQWKPVNRHQSFNAIVENGSFIRFSRYFPQIGYQADNEIDDEKSRKKYNLGKATAITPLDAPKVSNNNFIDLDMVITTNADQTVVGIGELIKQWKKDSRAFFRYQAKAIPFRFAISSAKYTVKKEIYKDKLFEIYYHPTHFENVDYLIKNAKITMDYCESNFGKYPFKTIRFAEISSFTEGFNATAYPASIYMTEQMAFHSNITADKKQDVINELAGHELSHMWWGNSQIDPDDREGDVMLTETLAMYTELMLLKKMYGRKKTEENVKMHEGIYKAEKGFSGDIPLVKAIRSQTYISYSKGAVAMYKLSELIGEENVNKALKNFLMKNKYPHPKPISTDFLEEVYLVSDKSLHKKIKDLFWL